MRRLLSLLLAALLVLSLAGCAARGDTSRVRLDQGVSETLPKEDVRAAMDAAMAAFRRSCGGMTLLRLRYDEAYSAAWVTARDGVTENPSTLVLLVHYRDADGAEHTGVPWVLTRDQNGNWKAGDLP